MDNTSILKVIFTLKIQMYQFQIVPTTYSYQEQQFSWTFLCDESINK